MDAHRWASPPRTKTEMNKNQKAKNNTCQEESSACQLQGGSLEARRSLWGSNGAGCACITLGYSLAGRETRDRWLLDGDTSSLVAKGKHWSLCTSRCFQAFRHYSSRGHFHFHSEPRDPDLSRKPSEFQGSSWRLKRRIV